MYVSTIFNKLGKNNKNASMLTRKTGKLVCPCVPHFLEADDGSTIKNILVVKTRDFGAV